MSDFLRDLSPHRTHEATRAVAVLPSPFEAIHPLRTVRVDATPLAPVDDRIALARPSAPSLHDSPAPAAALSGRHVTPAEAVNTPARPIATVRSNDAPARPALDVGAHVPSPTSTNSTRSTRHVGPVVSADHAATGATPASAAIVAPTIGPDTALPYRVRPRPLASASSAPLATDAPMSSRALAARTTPRAEQAPIINVTIDRIDVRAPAAPEHAKPSTRSRPSAPNLSLSDYLRGGESVERGLQPARPTPRGGRS